MNSDEPVGAEIPRRDRLRASPRARRAIRAGHFDVSQLIGTGPNQRILATDLEALRPAAAPGDNRRPMSSVRKTIARRLVQSKQTIPHFYIRQSIDAGALMEFYAARKRQHSCSLNDLVVKAAALAIREFPEFRSRLDEDTIVESAEINIGIAVGLDSGLVVPSVLEADSLSLADLSARIRALVESARNRQVENAGRSVFTVSNLGMFGTEEFSAIINPPEAAILAVGAVRPAAIVVAGALMAGLVMVLTLSCDHRIIDGMVAAKFMAHLQRSLEAPTKYLSS